MVGSYNNSQFAILRSCRAEARDIHSINPEVSDKMKVAYVFATNMAATYKLGKMILPQLERDGHGAEVVGMMFFDDNLYVLRQGEPVGERLAAIAKQRNILLMVCDRCAMERGFAEGDFSSCGMSQVKAKGLVEGVVAGCFPQLYEALSANPPDQVITL